MSLSNFPTIRPSLILDFQKAEVLDPRITFTRASTATRYNSYGLLETVGTDIPRIDFNPTTLVSNGLLIEEQRTNSIRNNTMVGAVAGTPGTLPTNWSTFTGVTGLTREVVGTGTENGITYLDVRVSGTPSASGAYTFFFDTSTGVAALNGQTWTNSGYFKLQAGSLTGITAVRLYFQENNSAGSYLIDQSINISNPTSAALGTQRASATRTLNQATTAFLAPGFNLLLTGVAIDVTLRIGLPQLELGAFATSVIPTSTTAVTRSADVASMTGTNFSSWYNTTEGTLFAQGNLISSSYGGGVLADIGAGGVFGTTEYIAWSGTTWALNPNVAPINVFSSVTTSSTAKIAIGIKANNSVISANGLIGTTDVSCAVAASPTALSVGKGGWSGAGNYFNGWIQRISYYPTRLPNSTLQALTA